MTKANNTNKRKATPAPNTRQKETSLMVVSSTKAISNRERQRQARQEATKRRREQQIQAALKSLEIQSRSIVDKCLAEMEKKWAIDCNPDLEKQDIAYNMLELLINGWGERYKTFGVSRTQIQSILDDVLDRID